MVNEYVEVQVLRGIQKTVCSGHSPLLACGQSNMYMYTFTNTHYNKLNVACTAITTDKPVSEQTTH